MSKIVFNLILILGLNAFGQELLENPDFSGPGNEITCDWREPMCKSSIFTEDRSWNKCLKFEVNEISVTDKGIKQIGGKVMLGKTGGLPGFIVKPGAIYRFRFEAKGTVPNLFSAVALFHNEEYWPNNVKFVKSSLDFIKPTGEWQKYEGTFRTGVDTTRAALVFGFWGDSSQQREFPAWANGQYVLIDNVSIQERSEGGTAIAAVPAREKTAFTLPASGSGLAALADKSVKANVKWSVSAGNNGITARVTLPAGNAPKVTENGSGIWKDDVVELFFGPIKNDRVLSQFCMASGGGRYMTDGSRELKNYDAWKGEVKDGVFTFEIPFSIMGFEQTPSKGETLAFNLGVQHNGKPYSFSSINSGFHEVGNFPVLILGASAEYLSLECSKLAKDCPDALKAELNALAAQTLSATDAVARIADFRQKITREKFGKAPFLAIRLSPTGDMTLPLDFKPEQVIAGTMQLTAAVNERKALPIAIFNRTAKAASYRVVVHPNLRKDEVEYPGLASGFPGKNIIMREAVRIKVSDSKDPDTFYDPLPRMNQAQTVTVAANDTALVWIAFDCKDINPGIYKGAVRVIPLSEVSKTLTRGEYKGEIQDYPFTLEVLPIILKPSKMTGHGCVALFSEEFFREQVELWGGQICLSPFWFNFKFDKNGNITDAELPELVEKIKTANAWFHKLGMAPQYHIGLNAYPVFELYIMNKSIKKASPEWENAWRNHLKAIQRIMKQAGLACTDYDIELIDEPNAKNFERDFLMVRLAREALPDGVFSITWPPKGFGYTPDMIRKFLPYIKCNVFHDSLVDDPDYIALIEEIRRHPTARVGYYVCNDTSSNSLHRYYRLWSWKGFDIGAKYLWFYIFSDSPYELGVTSWKQALGGGIAYRIGNDCIPSIRMEAMREGLTDIAYIECLPDDDPYRKQAAKKVLRDSPGDPLAPDAVRQEVVKKLLTNKDKNQKSK